jgi:hypothetical protein
MTWSDATRTSTIKGTTRKNSTVTAPASPVRTSRRPRK